MERGNSTELQILKEKISQNDKKIEALVNSLAKAENTPSYDYIIKEINELHKKNEQLKNTLADLNYQIQQNNLSENEFDILESILVQFSESFDLMSYEEKRRVLRVFIDKVTWDGENVHIYLFGADRKVNEKGRKGEEAKARGLQMNCL